MKKIWCWGLLLTGLTLTACSSDEANETDGPQEPEVPQVETRQAVDIVTRTESGETAGSSLQAGLYMVNYAEGRQVALQPSGNYVNNMLLSYADGSWTPDSPIYWLDTNVSADFYAYAP